jgi:hypothetical protein
MKLHQLRKDFNTLSWEEQVEFVREYSEIRDRDIAQETIIQMKPTKKKSATSTGKKKLVTVSNEQLELLKTLGLV